MGTFGERFFPLSFTTLREREEEREEEEERERERGREREEEHMVDFQGQKFVETFALVAISSASFVGFALGYALQDYRCMRDIIFASILASCVVTLPNWPFLSRHPIEWREIDDEHPSRQQSAEEEEEEEEEKEHWSKRLIRRFIL